MEKTQRIGLKTWKRELIQFDKDNFYISIIIIII